MGDSIMSKHLSEDERNELLNLPYEDFVERLGVEMGNFLNRAGRGRDNKYQGYRSRSASMRIRELLKEYRVVSLRREKYLDSKKKDNKENISDS